MLSLSLPSSKYLSHTHVHAPAHTHPSLSLSREQIPNRDKRSLTVLGAAAVNGQVQAMRFLVKEKVGATYRRHVLILTAADQTCMGSSSRVDVSDLFKSWGYRLRNGRRSILVLVIRSNVSDMPPPF